MELPATFCPNVLLPTHHPSPTYGIVRKANELHEVKIRINFSFKYSVSEQRNILVLAGILFMLYRFCLHSFPSTMMIEK